MGKFFKELSRSENFVVKGLLLAVIVILSASLAAVSGSTSSVQVSWAPVTTATDDTDLDNFSSYKVYYSTSSANANKTSGSLGSTVTSQGTSGTDVNTTV